MLSLIDGGLSGRFQGIIQMPYHTEPLPQIHLASDNAFAHPPLLPELVHLNDSALSVMTDLTTVKPATIRPGENIRDAEIAMKTAGVRMLFVVNTEMQTLGIVSLADLIGEKPIQVAQERKIHRDEVLVGAVMLPQSAILAIPYESLQHAKVGHIVDILHVNRRQHALVVECPPDESQQIIRGIFSSSQIGRQLGYDIMNDLGYARSLAELQRDLKS